MLVSHQPSRRIRDFGCGLSSMGLIPRVRMCDTDSVITDAKLNDYPDLMEEFMWDVE
jgi:hypothetical protein